MEAEDFLNGKTLLITGGAGLFGNAVLKLELQYVQEELREVSKV